MTHEVRTAALAQKKLCAFGTREGEYLICAACGNRVRTDYPAHLITVICGVGRVGYMPVVYDGPDKRTLRASIAQVGPGTELKKILIGVGAEPHSGCSCTSTAQEMDILGVEGCIKERDNLVKKLEENRKAFSWFKALSIGLNLVGEKWFSLNDPMGSLLDEAIRRSTQAK